MVIREGGSYRTHSALCVWPKLPFSAPLSAHRSAVPYGLVVRIPAFHAGGPGSIPGVGGRFD